MSLIYLQAQSIKAYCMYHRSPSYLRDYGFNVFLFLILFLWRKIKILSWYSVSKRYCIIKDKLYWTHDVDGNGNESWKMSKMSNSGEELRENWFWTGLVHAPYNMWVLCCWILLNECKRWKTIFILYKGKFKNVRALYFGFRYIRALET